MAHTLGQASLSPVLEGEGSSSVRDVGFSPLYVIPISGQRFSPDTLVCSPSLKYLQNKNLIQNSVIAEQALCTKVVTVLMQVCE